MASLKNLKQDLGLFSYIRTIEATIKNYKKVMPIIANVKEQEKLWDKFLMIFVLMGLHFVLDVLLQQALGNVEIGRFDQLTIMALVFHNNYSHHHWQFHLDDINQ